MREIKPLLLACLLGSIGCVVGAPEDDVTDEDEVVDPIDDEGSTVDEAGNEPVLEPEEPTIIAAAYPPMTLATNQAARTLFKDGSYLYWSTADSIMRVPTYGGTPVKMAGSLRAPQGVAVDSSNIYWAEYGNSTDMRCFIKKMPKTGGTITKLYTGSYGCAGLAIDGTHVYFTNYATGVIGSVNKGGSGLQLEVVGGRPREIVVDSSEYGIYWTNESRGTIEGFNGPSDGDIAVIARNQAPTHLKLAGQYVYWTNYDHGTVMRSSKQCSTCVDASDVPQTLAGGQAGPRGIDVSGVSLYWTNAVNGALMKANLDGSSRSKVATVEIGAEKLIVRYRASRTPPSLYWTNPSTKKVMKIDQY